MRFYSYYDAVGIMIGTGTVGANLEYGEYFISIVSPCVYATLNAPQRCQPGYLHYL